MVSLDVCGGAEGPGHVVEASQQWHATPKYRQKVHGHSSASKTLVCMCDAPCAICYMAFAMCHAPFAVCHGHVHASCAM